MSRWICLLWASSLLHGADSLEAFGTRWWVPVGGDWKQDTPGELHLTVARPSTQPRRPTQFALADTPDYRRVTLEAEVKRTGTSLILVYAYRDKDHFNYAHLSSDMGDKVPVHNGVFHVYGGDRVRISREQGPPSLPTEGWHKVRLEYDGGTGEVQVYVDGKPNPALRGVDLSLGAGKVGIGSFFETAQFRNVRIKGE